MTKKPYLFIDPVRIIKQIQLWQSLPTIFITNCHCHGGPFYYVIFVNFRILYVFRAMFLLLLDVLFQIRFAIFFNIKFTFLLKPMTCNISISQEYWIVLSNFPFSFYLLRILQLLHSWQLRQRHPNSLRTQSVRLLNQTLGSVRLLDRCCSIRWVSVRWHLWPQTNLYNWIGGQSPGMQLYLA